MSGYRDIANGNLMAQSMAGFFARSKSATLDNEARKTLVSRSRILYIESAIGRACIDVLLREVVGSGLRPDPKAESEFIVNFGELSDRVLRKLKERSTLHLIDSTNRLTFIQFQELVFRTILLSGDCFIVHLPDGTFCIKESDSVFTPSFLNSGLDSNVAKYRGRLVIDGVELDGQCRPVAYWFCHDPHSENIRKSWTRIPAFDDNGLPRVIHCMISERPEQFRGLPLLAPCIELLWSLHAYMQSETQMAILQACQGWVVTTNTNKSLNPFSGITQEDLDKPLIPDSEGDEEEHPASDDFTVLPPLGMSFFDGALRKTNFLQAGSTLHLAEGEDIKAITPTAPNSGLELFIKCITEQVGAATGIPAQILTARLDSNYASVKAAFSQMQHTTRLYRTMFIESFLKPFMQCFTSDCLGCESETAMVISSEIGWLPSSPQTILEPQREIAYYKEAINLGLISRDEVAQLLFGHDAVNQTPNNESIPVV
jgi:lambda family phage portal protein